MKKQNKNNYKNSFLGIELAIWTVAFAINPKFAFISFLFFFLLFGIIKAENNKN